MKGKTAIEGLRQGLKDAKVTSEQSVDAIIKFIKGSLTDAVKDETTKGELNRILTQVKEATKKSDLAPVIDEVYKIFLNTYIRVAENRHNTLTNTKTKGINQSGVRVAKTIDEVTRIILGGYKAGLTLDDTAYNERIGELQDIVADNDNQYSAEEKKQAAYELAGVEMARAYKIKLSRIDEDIVSQERAIASYKGRLKDEKVKENREWYRKQIKIAEDTITNLKEQKLELIENQNAELSQLIETGKNEFSKFIESQQAHKKEVLHMAFSDLKTVKFGDKQLARKDSKVSVFERTIKALVPFNTFITMIKKFSPAALRGEGKMYNYFVRGIQRAEDTRYTNFRKEMERLDEKCNELFGKKFAVIKQKVEDTALRGIDIPVVEVTLWNKNGMQETYPLSIGTAMYIYQCYKQADGRMKLEAMGIDEQKIEELKQALNS